MPRGEASAAGTGELLPSEPPADSQRYPAAAAKLRPPPAPASAPTAPSSPPLRQPPRGAHLWGRRAAKRPLPRPPPAGRCRPPPSPQPAPETPPAGKAAPPQPRRPPGGAAAAEPPGADRRRVGPGDGRCRGEGRSLGREERSVSAAGRAESGSCHLRTAGVVEGVKKRGYTCGAPRGNGAPQDLPTKHSPQRCV